MRVARNVSPQRLLVRVEIMASVTFALSHRSVATGVSKVHSKPHSKVRFGAQLSAGGVVSTTVIVCEQVLELPQASVALQVRVAAKVPPQKPTRLVRVITTWRFTLGPLQLSVGTRGESKLQSLPHSTVWLGPQAMTGGVV